MNILRNSPRRSPALAILGLVAAFALLGASGAHAASLTTKFDSNNGAAGNTFDLVVKPASGVTVTGLDLNLSANPGCVEVWTHADTSVGFETSSAGWTFQGAATVPAAGVDVPSPAPISFFLPQGSYGVVILARDCGGGAPSMNYTNGGPTVFEDASLKLTTRKGTDAAFFTGAAGLFDPREWNGTIHYEVGSGGGVALFNDVAFVDAALDPPDGEVKNVEASLKAKGHPVTKFSLRSAAALNAVLAGKDALVIPETENGVLTFEAPARGAIQNFVEGGGQLVVQGQGSSRTGQLINHIFGIFEMAEATISAASPPAPRRAGAAGTEFASGPASLPRYSLTAGVTLASLGQAGGKSIYDDGSRAWVATIPRGSGSITYLGWDWFCSSPPTADCFGTGPRDGGWQDVLDRAIDRPSLTIADASVAEGDSGTTNATVTATLSQPVSEAVSVSYATANETAAAGSDYTASSGKLTFPRGTTTQQISVPILGDTEVEPNESFLVKLSDPVATRLSSTSARVTIVNDDVDTIITKRPPRKTRSNKAKFEFVSNPPGGTFECSLDRKAFKPCSSPHRVKRLKVGRYQFAVRAIDAAGKVDPTPASLRWRVQLPKQVRFKLDTAFARVPGATRVQVFKLRATGISKGVKKLRVRCEGGGCPFGKKSVKTRGKGKGKANLKGLFGNRLLGPRAKIEIRGTRKNWIGLEQVILIKNGQIKQRTLCVKPGGRKAQKCAKVKRQLKK